MTHAYAAGYDAANHMTSRTETDRTNGANVHSTTFGYDSRGNLVWQVNAEGNPTRFTFDGLSRLTKKEVALGYGSPITTFTSSIDTQWGFDKNNRLVSFKDDAANESTWAYDAKDRQTSMAYPNATSIAYVYDANDNATQVTDAAGNVISDTFDALNRNTARSASLVSGFQDTTSETRTFDALNRVLTNDDNDYQLTYTYGVRGLSSTVYEEKQAYATGTPHSKVVTTKADAVGNRTYQNYPSGLTLTYAYNDIHALASVTDGTNSIASMTYVGFRPKGTTFGNGTTASYAYAGFREDLTTIHHETSAPATLVRLDYGYNKLHDRTYERYGTSGSAGDAFEYDKARRLTKAWMGSGTPSSPSGNVYVQTIQYAMDDDGNRTSVVTTPYGVSPTTESYTTNTLNQYTAVGGASPTYDGNGNLTDNGTYKFKYSYRNLITEARLSSNNGLVATYTFDASGRRVGKAVSGGVTERYVYADVETIAVYDGSNGLEAGLRVRRDRHRPGADARAGGRARSGWGFEHGRDDAELLPRQRARIGDGDHDGRSGRGGVVPVRAVRRADDPSRWVGAIPPILSDRCGASPHVSTIRSAAPFTFGRGRSTSRAVASYNEIRAAISRGRACTSTCGALQRCSGIRSASSDSRT